MKSPHTQEEQVTTEPQRRALEAMSADLVRKLNLMVAEQEARARDFAAHQHSLSALPIQPQPQVQALHPQPKKKKYAQSVPTPPPVQHSTPSYHQEAPYQAPAADSSYSSYLPPVPKAPPTAHKQPTIIKGKKKNTEEGVSATTIIVILLIVLALMSKACQ